MRATVVLAFLMCLTLRLFPHEIGEFQAEAQCKFSDGNTVKVTRIPERKTYELATTEDLLTMRGMSVPAGHYTMLPVKDLATAVGRLRCGARARKASPGNCRLCQCLLFGAMRQGNWYLMAF